MTFHPKYFNIYLFMIFSKSFYVASWEKGTQRNLSI
jgi:hypothetical protein